MSPRSMVTSGNKESPRQRAPALPPHDTALSAGRVLAHELAGLIDAAGRSARLADACLASGDAPHQRDAARLHLHRTATALDFAASALRTALAAADLLPAPSLAPARTLHEITEQAAQLQAPLARERHVELHIDIGAVASHRPPLSIFNALSNALANAVRHARSPGGRVALRASIRKDRLVIDITNDGAAPDDAALSRAFDPGFSTTGGAGLGLAVARRALESAGGTATLSQGPGGHGALFRADLPLNPGTTKPTIPNAGWSINEWGE